jgi:hypothetical protein
VGRVGLRTKLADDVEGQKIANDLSIPHNKAAQLLGTSEASVRRYRKEIGKPKAKSKNSLKMDTERSSGPSLEIIGNEGKLDTGPLDEPITTETGWAPVMRLLGIGDPENWQVVDDTVRISAWQTSKGLDDGTRDVKTLYSYRCRITRKNEEMALADEDLEAAVKRMRTKRYTIKRSRTLGDPVGYMHHQGDEQIGKNKNNDGMALLEHMETIVLEKSIQYIKDQMRLGENITEIMDNAAGDRIENVFGHYNSQSRTTETMRAQINYAVESDIARTEAFAAFGLPITKVYTPSNHGEMRQAVGSSPFTSDSDNWDLIIAEQVKRVLDRSPIADQITWHIPHGNPFTTLTFAGVDIAAAHGHKADGKNLHRWVKDQQGLFLNPKSKKKEDRFVPQIMLLGHKHHFQIEEINGTVLLQTGSLDQGSPYFEHGWGERAEGGALGFLVGSGFKGCVSKIDFL